MYSTISSVRRVTTFAGDKRELLGYLNVIVQVKQTSKKFSVRLPGVENVTVFRRRYRTLTIKTKNSTVEVLIRNESQPISQESSVFS